MRSRMRNRDMVYLQRLMASIGRDDRPRRFRYIIASLVMVILHLARRDPRRSNLKFAGLEGSAKRQRLKAGV